MRSARMRAGSLALPLLLGTVLVAACQALKDALGPNAPPDLSLESAYDTVRAGQTLRLPISAVDMDQDRLTFRLTGHPSFVTVEDVSQPDVIANATLVIAPARSHSGPFSFVVSVEDEHHASDSETFTVEVEPAVSSVTVSPGTATVPAHTRRQLTATPRSAASGPLTGRDVTWSSSAPSVAAVDAEGMVSGVAAGSATITATSEGVNGTAAITVTVGTTPRLGFWQVVTAMGGMAFRVDAVGTTGRSIGQATFRFRNLSCGQTTWNHTAGEFGYPNPWTVIQDGVFVKQRSGTDSRRDNGGNLFGFTVLDLWGLFDAGDHVIGRWIFEAGEWFHQSQCPEDWVGGPATALYLRVPPGQQAPLYLANTPDSSLSNIWAAVVGVGASVEWKAILGGPIGKDAYTFYLGLGSGSQGAPDGVFAAALLVGSAAGRQQLASTTLQVPYAEYFEWFADMVNGVAGGAAGDTVVLRVSYTNQDAAQLGGILFGAHPYSFETRVLVGGSVSVTKPAGAAVVAAAPAVSGAARLVDRDALADRYPWRVPDGESVRARPRF